MKLTRALRKLILGETWLLPLGVAVAVLASVAVRHVAGGEWHQIGGFVLLAGVLAVVLLSVSRSAGS